VPQRFALFEGEQLAIASTRSRNRLAALRMIFERSKAETFAHDRTSRGPH
jgi:hypothetical protein